MRDLTLYSNTSFTIKEVIIYVPKQPVLVDLSAGAPCVLYSESLSDKYD